MPLPQSHAYSRRIVSRSSPVQSASTVPRQETAGFTACLRAAGSGAARPRLRTEGRMTGFVGGLARLSRRCTVLHGADCLLPAGEMRRMWAAVVLVLAVLGALLLIWLGQRTLIYFPDRDVASPDVTGLPDADVVQIPAADGVILQGW